MVTVFFWSRGDENKRGWNTKQYYHPQCWVEHGLDYLKRNPYVPFERSRKLQLTKSQARKRLLLLKRKGALDQRKKNIKSDYPDRVLIEARLNKQIAELMVEIARIGGIPKKWLGGI